MVTEKRQPASFPNIFAGRMTQLGWTLLLLLAGFIHRTVQLYFLFPQINEHVSSAHHVMQLLPPQVWREHFWAGLLYLQQSPPLPNVVFGLLSKILIEPSQLVLGLFFLQGLIGCLTTVLLFRLLGKFGVPLLFSLLLSLIFLFSGDIVLLEYNAMGNFFYEQMTMLLCLLSCHIAFAMHKDPSVRGALLLGLVVALLALTRSTFSYFFLLVSLWILLLRTPNKAKLLVYFYLPVVLLHGGWSTKNALVHGYWKVATSTWGGANARTGDIRRSDAQRLYTWLEHEEPLCEKPWWDLSLEYRNLIFFFPDKQAILNHPQPPELILDNKKMAEARGLEVFYDTHTVRLWSECLERIYIRYWRAHPLQTLQETAKSYQVFWLPIQEFVVRNPRPAKPGREAMSNELQTSAWSEQLAWELRGSNYQFVYADLSSWPDIWRYENTRMLILPVLPLLVYIANFFALHVLLLLMSVRWLRTANRDKFEPSPLLYPVLCYLYVAGLSSRVEFGENMRFRLEVEPIIWLLSAVCICQVRTWLRGFIAKRRETDKAAV